MVRREEDYVGRRVMGIEVQGKRKGRPKRRWLDSARADRTDKGCGQGGTERPNCWRRTYIDPQISEEDEETPSKHSFSSPDRDKRAQVLDDLTPIAGLEIQFFWR